MKCECQRRNLPCHSCALKSHRPGNGIFRNPVWNPSQLPIKHSLAFSQVIENRPILQQLSHAAFPPTIMNVSVANYIKNILPI